MTAMDLTDKKDGGVMKEIVKEGNGTARPQKMNKVKVHYVGTLEADGSKFDSSRDRGELFEFTLGKGEVIKAWDLGVASMTRGEVAILTCGAEYAYGAQGSPPKIPADATLKFEVELFDWSAEDISPDGDRTITRQTITAGEKYTTPNDGAKVTVTAKGYLLQDGERESKAFFDSTVSFPLGEAQAHGLPEGVDKALLRMDRGERSEIELSARWAYGQDGNAPLGVPANAKVLFDLSLDSFEKCKQSWELNTDEKLDEAEKMKARGTEFFQQNKLSLAIGKYKKVDDLLGFEKNLEGDKLAKRNALMLAAHLNMSLCHLKQGAYIEAIKHANSVLELQADNTKALYRRAQALEKQKEYEDAVKDYESVLKHDATNKAAAQQLQFCKAKVREQLNEEKQRYKNMFSIGKVNKTDTKHTNGLEDANGECTPEVDAAAVSAKSLCHLKQGAYIEAIKHANSVLELQADNTKALYRRAQALEKQKEYEDAVKDYESVLKHDATNKAAAQQLQFCKAKVREQLNEEKQRYKNMFSIGKVNKTDAKHTNGLEDANGECTPEVDAAAVSAKSLCHLKQGAYIEAIKHANSVLELQADNTKALYRRAQALEKQKEYEDAVKDYESVLKHDATNKAAAQQLQFCKAKVREQLNEEKQRYKNMFSIGKVNKTDTKHTNGLEDANGECTPEVDAAAVSAK